MLEILIFKLIIQTAWALNHCEIAFSECHGTSLMTGLDVYFFANLGVGQPSNDIDLSEIKIYLGRIIYVFFSNQGWGQFRFFNSIPIPLFSIPIPIPIPLLIISFNSNSNSGDFNSNSNSRDFKSNLNFRNDLLKYSVKLIIIIITR